jgi:leader peptidase (prepilin peptidase)/N-methyltransferase
MLGVGMSFFCGIIWCVIALTVCILTRKYYIPYYINSKKHTQTSDDSKSTDEKDVKSEPVVRSKILDNKTVKLIFYILIGIFSAVFGFFTFNNASDYVSLAKIFFCMLILLMIVVTDTELSIIPNLLVLILLLSRFIFLVFDLFNPQKEAWKLLLNNVIVSLVILAFLIIMSKITRGGLGAGDIKLYAALAFVSNLNTVVFTLFFALLGSALLSIVLLILKKKKLRDSFPMGPFICLGFGLTIILGLA